MNHFSLELLSQLFLQSKQRITVICCLSYCSRVNIYIISTFTIPAISFLFLLFLFFAVVFFFSLHLPKFILIIFIRIILFIFIFIFILIFALINKIKKKRITGFNFLTSIIIRKQYSENSFTINNIVNEAKQICWNSTSNLNYTRYFNWSTYSNH